MRGVLGSGAGSHGGGLGGRRARRSESKTTLSRSVPETPSTMQWWTLETSAQRPSPRPSTIHISHSGLRAVELLRHHAADEVAQLLVAARRGQRGAAHVVVEVEVRVVDPDRAAERERREAHAAGGSAGRGAACAATASRTVVLRRRGALEDRPPSRCACGSPRPPRAGTRHRARSSSPCRKHAMRRHRRSPVTRRGGPLQLARADDQHVAGRALGNQVGDAPDEPAGELAALPRADDDQPRVLLGGDVGEDERRIAAAHVRRARAGRAPAAPRPPHARPP